VVCLAPREAALSLEQISSANAARVVSSGHQLDLQ
jgi:hypothetical protein